VRLFPRFGPRRAPRTRADADRIALKQLEKLGADLTKPRHVIHFVYFEGEGAARRAAAVIEQAGYSTQLVAPDDRYKEWRVHADSTRVMSETTVDGFRSWFEHIASVHDGEYDGWEAARTP
jgi:Regulator of ribonuclease activity B